MNGRTQHRVARLLLAVLLIGVVASLIVQVAAVIDGPPASTPTVPPADETVPTSSADDTSTSIIDDPSTTSSADEGATARFSDLPTISPADLPAEAIDTLNLIADGGPFPYDQDDGVFQNREGLLPARPDGHYREYTVETPGSDDRGARRIVAGADGELYYTDDHYDSFSEIVVGGS